METFKRFLRRFWRTEIAAGVATGLLFGAALLVLNARPQTDIPASNQAVVPVSSPSRHIAELGGYDVSVDVRYMANWIADTQDASGLPFLIIDKKDAKLYVFDGAVRLIAASPVLLGSAPGDHTVPGIGDRQIDDVLPHERTTPAGRFIGEPGLNARGEDVVWVDYDAAVSLHRVLTINPGERRLERLASETADDNRISYGCINLPVVFYESHVRPMFANQRAPIYVLPEVKTLDEVFGSYDVGAIRGSSGVRLASGETSPLRD